MNTYYVPMDHDIPHAENTRYERKMIFNSPFESFVHWTSRDVEILSMVAIYTTVYGVVLLFSTDDMAIIE